MLDDAENTFHHAAQPTECLQALQHLPYWRERAAYAEKNRRLSSDTFTELFDNTWLDLLSPQAPATSSGHWPTLVEISRIAARACSSTGWILALVGSHSCIVRRLPPPCQVRLYAKGSQQLFASASTSSDSHLYWEAGGVRMNGRWRFSSAIEDATWLIVNAPCPNHPDAEQTPRFLLLLAAQDVRRLDSWDSFGMAATGSHDVLADQILVPHEQVFALNEVFAHHPRSPGTDYLTHMPLAPYLTTSIIGPLLGCAEGAHASYVEALINSPAGRDPRIAEQVAHSAAQLYSARLLYNSLVSQLHDAGIHDRTLDGHQLLQLKRDRAYLAKQCVQVVQRLVERLGASSLVASNPLQRHWRDIQAMAAHRDLAWNDAMLAYGETILRSAKAAESA